MRILKYKNIFAKDDTPNWFEEDFLFKKIKNVLLWMCVINDLNGEEIVETLYENELQKPIKKNLELKK